MPLSASAATQLTCGLVGVTPARIDGENLRPGGQPRCNVRSGHDYKRWYLRPMIDYLVDSAEILGRLCRHKKITLQRLFDLLQRLASMLHVDLVCRLLLEKKKLGVQHDVCRLALEAALGLMHQDARIWQRET